MQRLLPGDRSVWLGAVVVGALLTMLVIYEAAVVERDFYTGTNGVIGRSPVITPERGQRLCLERARLPPGTGRLRFDVQPLANGGRLEATVTASGRTTAGRSEPLIARRQYADIPIAPLAVEGESRPVTLCVSPLGIDTTFFGVVELESDEVSPTLDGKHVGSMVAAWYLPPPGSQRTFAQALPDVIERAALFRPAPIGAWTYVLALLLLPALGYAAVRLLALTASGGEGGAVRAFIAIAAVAFLHAASWALITPPFNAPDEMEHYAYGQYLAETGKAPCQACPEQPRSTEEAIALDGVGLIAYIESPDGRPEWLASEEHRFEFRDRVFDPASNDGGGVTTAASHAPPYYALLSPAYLVAALLGGDVFDRLAVMRLVSALLAALTAGFAFLMVRELLPHHRLVAVLAGLLVALHPMFAFIGGAVNNDNGINAMLALIAYLLVRTLRRGLTLSTGLALGGALVLAPLFKSTGYAAYPPAIVTLAIVLLRQHGRKDIPAWLGLAGAFGALSLTWSLLSPSFDRSVYGTPGGGAPGSQPAIAAAADQPFAFLSYLWQVFLPRLPFMADLHVQKWPFFDIYIERGFAAFGWYAVKFPTWVYLVIVIGLATICTLAVRAAFLNRAWVRRAAPAVAVLTLLVLTVIAGVHASFFSTTGDRPVVAEQGRYAFSAITVFAAGAASSCYGLGLGRAPVLAAVILVGALGLAWGSQLLALSAFFT